MKLRYPRIRSFLQHWLGITALDELLAGWSADVERRLSFKMDWMQDTPNTRPLETEVRRFDNRLRALDCHVIALLDLHKKELAARDRKAPGVLTVKRRTRKVRAKP